MVDVYCGQCTILHTVWWMSVVVDVLFSLGVVSVLFYMCMFVKADIPVSTVLSVY